MGRGGARGNGRRRVRGGGRGVRGGDARRCRAQAYSVAERGGGSEVMRIG